MVTFLLQGGKKLYAFHFCLGFLHIFTRGMLVYWVGMGEGHKRLACLSTSDVYKWGSGSSCKELTALQRRGLGIFLTSRLPCLQQLKVSSNNEVLTG